MRVKEERRAERKKEESGEKGSGLNQIMHCINLTPGAAQERR